jgi:hypothetical protein
MSIIAPVDNNPVALIYLARGADVDHSARSRRFLQSYRRFKAGEVHSLMIIFKGFADANHLTEGREVFRSLDYHPLFTGDDSFDLGACFEAARQISHERLCFLNSSSEILNDGWLSKLSANFLTPGVGIVGATASFETLLGFPSFPNPHIRSNAFMIRRHLFLELLSGFQLTTKLSNYSAERGPAGMTQQVFERGMAALVVGRDGRGYTPSWWPHSETFRQGSQSNLLVGDDVTRTFENLPFGDKMEISQQSWGEFLLPGKHL